MPLGRFLLVLLWPKSLLVVFGGLLHLLLKPGFCGLGENLSGYVLD